MVYVWMCLKCKSIVYILMLIVFFFLFKWKLSKGKKHQKDLKTSQLSWHTVERKKVVAWEEEERRRKEEREGIVRPGGVQREGERGWSGEREMILRSMIGQFKKERGQRKKKEKRKKMKMDRIR